MTLFLFLVSKLLTGANSCVEWPVVDWGLRSWAAGGRLLALLAFIRSEHVITEVISVASWLLATSGCDVCDTVLHNYSSLLLFFGDGEDVSARRGGGVSKF